MTRDRILPQEMFTDAVIEQVARAIERSTCENDEDLEQSWTYENVRHNRRLEARAAIAALVKAMGEE